MADVRISQLPAATAPQADDVAPLVSGGITTKATPAQIVTAALTATPVTLGQGGTGATAAPAARTALGLGTVATQNATAVAITGGTINGATIGATTPSTGVFTNLTANDNVVLGASNADTVAVNGRITTGLEPNTDNANDIGTSGRNWRNGNFSGSISASSATLTTATVTGSTTAGNALVQITQTGAGYALLVEDQATPDTSPFVIHASGAVSVGNTIDAGANNLYVSGNTAATDITASGRFIGGTLKASATGLVVQNDGSQTQMTIGAGAGNGVALSVDLTPVAGTVGMTSGFVFIPGATGAPTGTPTSTATGAYPMYVDTTSAAERLYVYVNGAWKYTALTT